MAFDLDDTLINTSTATQLAVTNVLSQIRDSPEFPHLPEKINANKLNEALRDTRRTIGENYYSLKFFKKFSKTYLEKKDMITPYKLYIKFNDMFSYVLGPYPDVIPFLDFIGGVHKGEGIPLSLITSGDGIFQRKKLARTNLDKYFVAHYISDPKKEKLKTDIFKKYLNEFDDESPKSFIYIGDRYAEDVSGPKKLGINTVIVKRWDSHRKDNKPKNESETPHLEVESLNELLKYFEI